MMRTRDLPIFVREFLTEWFPTAEDAIWKQWVDRGPRAREQSDLVGLLTSDVRDSFKRRALYLLVVPSKKFNPIYWKKEEIGGFYGEKGFLDALPSLSFDLLLYVAGLVSGFCLRLKKLHNDRSSSGEWHDALSFYSCCILKLLSLLPMEKSEELFLLYSLRSISTSSDRGGASAYTPFGLLLYSKEVGEYWKVRADSMMWEIIRSELAGKSKPREQWEDALSCYARIVEAYLWNDSPYSVELFESQIDFLLRHHSTICPLIIGYRLPKMFDVLSGDKRKDLRHRIARASILEYEEDDWRRFSVRNEIDIRTANRVMREYPDDVELVDCLRFCVKSYKRRVMEDARREAEKKKREEDILAQMK